MDGIINVLKPSGMTSFDVIAKLRKIYGQKQQMALPRRRSIKRCDSFIEGTLL